MAGHPDITEISDLTEGLLPPARSEDIRRHLEECAPCTDLHASLEEIRELMGNLPTPSAMPDDVADRIDAALAAEAEGPSGDTHDRVRVSRETSPVSDRPSGGARSSTTGPGRKGSGSPRDRRRGGPRRIAVLGAVAAVAALGLGSVIVTSLSGNDDPGTTAHAKRAAAVESFSEEGLQEQVTALLAGTAGPSATPRTFGAESGAGEKNRLLREPALPGCVQQGIGRDDAVLATEDGVYQGRRAMLVVLPDRTDDRRVTAYLVESTCVDQPSMNRAKVLFTRSYARP
ncbi:zf-HC2 domain-containing protein [Streptomyces sp. SID8352]|uniref:anti-sigma factor family protein n=1 Tax=Streptomyces sp. SID8352 TaxID=2690338 RepID=UPI0013717616|nr:zf-HC2 domain-containing protein [Streptomyces sp. SID8352]MYU25479.1 hypothetical protein [Streptomyces sp. SID8352]